MFPLNPGPRWQSSSTRPVALALQQALGQELARVRQGSPEVPGISVRLLQAVATLLNSPHGGALAMAMHRSHFLACPLLRQLSQYQVGALRRVHPPEARCPDTAPWALVLISPGKGRSSSLRSWAAGGSLLLTMEIVQQTERGPWTGTHRVFCYLCPVCFFTLYPKSRAGKLQMLAARLARGGAFGGL